MDGIHDMGGMHGFGAVPTSDDVQFHAQWERETYAMMKLLGMQGQFNTHQMRATVERMAPKVYLESTYFERWLTGIEDRLLEDGVLSQEELREAHSTVSDGTKTQRSDDDLVSLVRERFSADAFSNQTEIDPRFEEGDSVVAKNSHPFGHTRLPGYVRRARGSIRKYLGTFHLPDAAARGDTSVTEPMYSVGFDAAELWGDDAEGNGTIYIDLFESYLESPESND
ncbi:nitrile hydratase subunit beta [Haloferax sp. MBLA0076]|uniref:nitrile hydratase n=1 Tax=Haloferax litoreum TaxID=2666140 RepID=A0A6A8GJI0_9EURY|nr:MULTISPECIES: nitrile hydratase subunit beta [Haloferax]KAB1190443.1 nitrile hydratase subunit beta [Haloferax sp. CBA1148]MRX23418.1 nitrile hydratase subunit beta [Haloferax litoreum]